MSIVVLAPPGPQPPPRPEWLADSGTDLVLVTGRGDGPGEPAGGIFDGYSEVRVVERFAGSADAETAVLETARRGKVSAVVALDPADWIRAGGLRDHLGLPGPSRDDALVLIDPVAARALLLRAGVPVVRRDEVRRVADLYWYAHRWGYPLVVRRRRDPGRTLVAGLADEAALRAFADGGLPADPSVVPSLTAESPVRGERHRGPGNPATDAALAVLPDAPGHPYAVEAVRTAHGEWLVDTVVPDPGARSPRALARAQAGLDAGTGTGTSTETGTGTGTGTEEVA